MLHYRRAFRNAAATADIGEMMSSVCVPPCAQALQRKYHVPAKTATRFARKKRRGVLAAPAGTKA